MPFVTVPREKESLKLEEVYYPEIKWKIDTKDHEGKYEKNEQNTEKGIVTFIIEQAPRKRVIKYREQFYAGDHTEHYLSIPWTYYMARVSKKGVILLSAMWFSNEELKSTGQEGLCAAPMPNFDYGSDKCLGVCLWKSQATFGKTQEAAVVKCHEYIWTSVFNPGVRYYDRGRPEAIISSSWPGSIKKWEELTEKNEKIEWVPVKIARKKDGNCGYRNENVPGEGKMCTTLDMAFDWLCSEPDHLYS